MSHEFQPALDVFVSLLSLHGFAVVYTLLPASSFSSLFWNYFCFVDIYMSHFCFVIEGWDEYNDSERIISRRHFDSSLHISPLIRGGRPSNILAVWIITAALGSRSRNRQLAQRRRTRVRGDRRHDGCIGKLGGVGHSGRGGGCGLGGWRQRRWRGGGRRRWSERQWGRIAVRIASRQYIETLASDNTRKKEEEKDETRCKKALLQNISDIKTQNVLYLLQFNVSIDCGFKLVWEALSESKNREPKSEHCRKEINPTKNHQKQWHKRKTRGAPKTSRFMTSTVEYRPPFSTAIRSRSRISALRRCGQSTATVSNGKWSAGDCGCDCNCGCGCGDDDGGGGDDEDNEAPLVFAFELDTDDEVSEWTGTAALSAAELRVPSAVDSGALPSHDGRRDDDADEEDEV
jgi:hypothetical protein